MAVEVEIDVELLKSEIKRTYASVSAEPDRDFIFPTGRAWAEDLRYPAELAAVPDAAAASFARLAHRRRVVRSRRGRDRDRHGPGDAGKSACCRGGDGSLECQVRRERSRA